MSKQALLDALHDMQLWGIVGQSMVPSLGKIRCGSNDEFLEAYRALEGEVRRLISDNEKLKALVRDMWHDGMCDCDEIRFCAQDEYHCAECEYHYPDRMRELGIEVGE